jgi:hypothetical protein
MSRHRRLIAAVALALPATAAYAQQVQNLDFPVTDGVVNAVEVQQGTNAVFVGGDFTYVAKNTGGMGIVSLTTGQLQTCPRVEGIVFAVAADGAGGFFIGGSFSQVGNTQISNLAHLAFTAPSTWSLTTTWAPNPDGPVQALELDAASGNLFVGGSYGIINGQFRNCLSSLSTTVTSVTLNAWNPGVTHATGSPSVLALKLDPTIGLVYAGGNFTHVSGTARPFVAQFPSASGGGVMTAWNPQPNAMVRALEMKNAGTDVFLGGDFQTIGGLTRRFIGKVTATGAVGVWNCNANASVFAIVAETSNTILVGGSFSTIGGSNRKCLARIDDAGANPTLKSWNPSARDAAGNAASVHALCRNATDICVGGNFIDVGSNHLSRLRIGSVGTTGTNDAATGWDPGTLPLQDAFRFGMVEAMATDNPGSPSFMCVGGSLAAVGGLHRTDLARFDATSGQMSAGFNANLSASAGFFVQTVKIDSTGTNLYAGGSLQQGTKFNVVQCSPTAGTTTGWAPQPNGTVRALEVFGGGAGAIVTMGGDFTLLNGTNPRGGIALVSGAGTIQAGAFPAVTGSVRSVSNDFGAGTLYVGGQFTVAAGGPTMQSVARFNVAARTLDNAWNAGLAAGSLVNAVAVSSNTVYLGGTYSTTNGPIDIGEFAKGGGGGFTTWRAQDTAGNVGISGGTVTSIFRATDINGASQVYIGGAFTAVGNTPRICIAGLGDSLGATPGVLNTTTFTLSVDGGVTAPVVNALFVLNTGGSVMAGGLFDRATSAGTTSALARPNLVSATQ